VKSSRLVSLPDLVEQHEWARAVLYRTHAVDIDNKVVILTDMTRLSLGEPFCTGCGTTYPPAGPCRPSEEDIEVMPPMAFEPIEYKTRSVRIDR
jgi:hypothetical protein